MVYGMAKNKCNIYQLVYDTRIFVLKTVKVRTNEVVVGLINNKQLYLLFQAIKVNVLIPSSKVRYQKQPIVIR